MSALAQSTLHSKTRPNSQCVPQGVQVDHRRIDEKRYLAAVLSEKTGDQNWHQPGCPSEAFCLRLCSAGRAAFCKVKRNSGSIH